MLPRDWELIQFIEEQGFVSYRQILNRFFENKSHCSKRLKKLCEFKYLESCFLLTFFSKEDSLTEHSGYFPHLLNLNIKPKDKIYFVGRVYSKNFGKSSKLFKKSMVLHQLVLNDIRLFLEKTLDYKQINNDPMLQVLGHIQPGRNKEIVPDLCFEHENIKIAIELERSLKGELKYSSRFSYFRDSIYTHVIYYYTDEAFLKVLLKKASFDPKFAFAHYQTPDDLYSNVFGRLSLNDFIFKVLNKRR